MLGLGRYQWLVLFAAWLGWGFDIFDGLLFNFVAPICIPHLLGLSPTEPASKQVIMYWTASLTSLLLVGWAIGGIFFGKLTDRLGRTRTLLLTMLTYALGTAACAFAPNVWILALFRFVAALGIGGEWAAGAALVAETLPRERRVLGGALLYTSAPCGLLLATFVNDLFTRRLEGIAADPSLSWRVVFLTGLIPAAVALLLRLFVRESEAWSKTEQPPALRELFTPELRARTLGGLTLAVVALVAWWSISAFIPVVAGFLAPSPAERTSYVTSATTAFNLGGVLGTLLTVPLATRWGRRPMFALYFAVSALGVYVAFGLELSPLARLRALFPVGIGIFGIFGAFSFYLPELFPTRLRGTGAGFCYNTGRLVTALFPFLVGTIVRSGVNPLTVLCWVGLVPVTGVLLVLLGVGAETREPAPAESDWAGDSAGG